MKKYIITEEELKSIPGVGIKITRDGGGYAFFRFKGNDEDLLMLIEYQESSNKPQKDISYHTKRSADATEKLADEVKALRFDTIKSQTGIDLSQKGIKLKDGTYGRLMSEDRVREIVTEMLNK